MSHASVVRRSTTILAVGSLLLGTLFLGLPLIGRAPSMAAFVGAFLVASGSYQLLALANLPERRPIIGTHDHGIAGQLNRLAARTMPLLLVAGGLWFAASFTGIDSPLISAVFLTAAAAFVYGSWTIVNEHPSAGR